ncbi:MAG: hypothetical protein LBK95_14120 [Bifidobacteriaceae bacterium]|jgi:hypothetical protein|nr:hypothetical protein [Bifidobacteriaceae bacterium]
MAVAIIVVVGVVVFLVARSMLSTDPRFADAVEECGAPSGLVEDRGRTLVLNGEGDRADPDALPVLGTACILKALDIASEVVYRMDHTAALDGEQEGSWGDFTATWTYFPDDGLDIVVKLTH